MSVSNVDRSDNNSDSVRQNRDEYKRKETELIKRHKREVRKLTDDHQRELDRLTDNEQKRLTELRSRTNQVLTDKEQAHQDSIEKMRETYMSSLRRNAQENEDKREAIRETHTSESDHQRLVTDSQKDALRRTYEADGQRKDERLNNLIRDLQEKSQRDYQEAHRRLTDAHKKEMKLLTSQRDQDLSHHEGDLDQIRRDNELQRLQREQFYESDKNRIQQNLVQTITDDRRKHSDSLDMMREGYKKNLEGMAQKYRDAEEKNRERGDDSLNGFQRSISDRVNDRQRQLERQIHELKEQRASEQARGQQRFDRGVKEIIDAYTRANEDYQEQAQRAQSDVKQKDMEKLERLRKDKDQMLVDTHHLYQDRIEKMKITDKEAMANQSNFHQNQKQEVEQRHDKRLKQLLNRTEQDKHAMREFMEESIAQTQNDKDETIRKIRTQTIDDHIKADTRLADSMRKQEAEHEEKLNMLQDRYQREMADLKAQQKAELKHLKTQMEKRLSQQSKATDMQLESQEIQHQRKLAQVNARHEEELKLVNKRHQEQVDHLVTHLKET